VAEFKTEREAKDYLAARIVEEAKREGTPLTEVERKMLYFSESGWTLPDMMAVNEEFERDYDGEEYEQKIGRLAAKIEARDAAESERDLAKWDDAVMKLSEGDHYLLILIDAAHLSGGGSRRWKALKPWLPSLDGCAKSDPTDLARLMVVAVIISAVLFLCLLVAAMLKR
jgi:hypothetical protein